MKRSTITFATVLLFASLASGQDARASGGFRVGVGTGIHFGHGHFGHFHAGRHRHYRHHHGAYYSHWHRHRAAPTYGTVIPDAALPPATPQQPRVDSTMTYDNSYCREYSRSAEVNGEAVEILGTACRQADGRWRIVN